MNRRDFLQTIGTAVPVAAVTSMAMRPARTAQQDKDIAERILDERKLNCGYIPYAPAMTRDPNTGKLGGLFFGLTERLGELVDLEINWNTETTYATFASDMRAQKYDIFGGGIWSNPSRAKVSNFSLPAFYSGVGLYVRNDDRRFDDGIQKLNSPRFRIATIDGEMSQIIQESDFPKASIVGLPDATDVSMLAENVLSGKADATFMDTAAADFYMRKNPGSLRTPANRRPVRIFENTWAFDYGSDRLKGILDAAIKEMIYSGFVDHVLAENEYEKGFFRVRMPIE